MSCTSLRVRRFFMRRTSRGTGVFFGKIREKEGRVDVFKGGVIERYGAGSDQGFGGALVLHDVCGHGGERHQDRKPERRSRRTKDGALPERRERVLHEPEQEQEGRHAEPQEPEGEGDVPGDGEEGRRRPREFPARNDGKARTRIRRPEKDQSEDRLRVHFRVRTHRSVQSETRIRHHRAGDGRTHEHHRVARRRGDAHGNRDGRHSRGAFGGRRRSCGIERAHGDGRGAEGRYRPRRFRRGEPPSASATATNPPIRTTPSGPPTEAS